MSPREGPELQLQRQLVQLAEMLGWEHMAVRPMMTKNQGYRTGTIGTMAKGWPDLVLVRPRDRRLLFVELKGSKRDKLRPEQERVIGEVLLPLAGDHPAALTRIGVHVWRPEDWPEIEKVLR